MSNKLVPVLRHAVGSSVVVGVGGCVSVQRRWFAS